MTKADVHRIECERIWREVGCLMPHNVAGYLPKLDCLDSSPAFFRRINEIGSLFYLIRGNLRHTRYHYNPRVRKCEPAKRIRERPPGSTEL